MEPCLYALLGGVQSETDMVAGLYGPCTYLPSLLCKRNTELQNLPAMWETWVQSQGWEDPLKGKATHSSILGLQNFMDCIVHGVAKSQT